MSSIAITLPLPEDYRYGDFLAFHHRDTASISERVTAHTIEKGVVWHGHAACVSIAFQDNLVLAQLSVDGAPASEVDWRDCVMRVLGLSQPVQEFEAQHAQHPQLGAVIARQRGLRVPVVPSLFEALTWAIIGQQISLKAALTLRRKLIQQAGVIHDSGLACYPDATHLARLSPEGLRALGFSASKAQTLLTVSQMVEEDGLPLGRWAQEKSVEEISQRLLAIRGIGTWTVDYTLLRGLGWLDGSLHGDAAVRSKLAHLLGRSEAMTASAVREWLMPFSPWRALVAAHLWHLPIN